MSCATDAPPVPAGTEELFRANARLSAEVAAREAAERELRRQLQLFRTLIDALPDSIYIKDEHGRYLLHNTADCRLLGLAPGDDGAGRTVHDFPATQAHAAAYTADDQAVLTSGQPVIDREEQFTQPDGSPGWFLTTKVPVRDEHGAVTGIVGMSRDISERRRAEEERKQLELKLQETQKLESLGVLAGGIAHDFNNLLTGILGNASLARLDVPPHSPVNTALQRIEQISLRAADLCKQMLAYAGKARFVVQPQDLTQLVLDTAHLLQVSISKKATLHFALAPGLPPVEADATQLRQIVMNLVINASEAIGELPGAITLATGRVRADARYLADTRPAGNLPAGEYVFLEVRDTGCGMTPELCARIFEPFYTTKFAGRGLGLAAVLGIVRGHRGALKVRSEPGRGSTFTLLLPIAPGAAVFEPPPPGPAAAGWRGHGRILVVDDEESVRAVVAHAIENLGFSVTLAADGREAVTIFTAQPDAFALVVMDLTMPHLDGVEATAQLRRLRPAVRVLLMSGYSGHTVAATFADQGLAGFLQKPFELSTLREKIRRVFETPVA